MQGLSAIRIPTTNTDVVCPIHNVQMIQGGRSKPFCPKCTAEKMKADKESLGRRSFEIKARKFINTSLYANPSTAGNRFDNFKSTPGSKEAKMGNSMYKLASLYIKTNPTPRYMKQVEPYKSEKPELYHLAKPLNAVVYGTPGEGKTHLAMSVLHMVNENSQPQQRCLFVDVNSMFKQIFRRKSDKEDHFQDGILKRIKEADLVVLDDLGTESNMTLSSQGSDFVQSFLEEIFDNQNRIIVTTNLTASELSRTYNAKLISRLNKSAYRFDFSGIKDKRALMK